MIAHTHIHIYIIIHLFKSICKLHAGRVCTCSIFQNHLNASCHLAAPPWFPRCCELPQRPWLTSTESCQEKHNQLILLQLDILTSKKGRKAQSVAQSSKKSNSFWGCFWVSNSTAMDGPSICQWFSVTMEQV